MNRRRRSRVLRCVEALEPRCLMTATLLQDVNTYGPYPEPYGTFDGWTYFRTQEPSGIYLLERTDGSGTTQVVERYERDGTPTRPIKVVAFQGSIVELVQDPTTCESWISKIDTATLRVSKTLPLWPDQGFGLYPNNLTVVNGQRLIFTDYTPSAYTTRLYGVDVGLDGVSQLADHLDNNIQFEHLGSSVVFLQDQSIAANLWITDGTPDGTRQLVAEPGVMDFTADGDRILYSHSSTATDQNLYVASVDAAGTIQILVNDVYVNKLGGSPDGTGYFATQTISVPADLYITDGTTAGTRYVTTVPWDAAPNLLVQAVIGGKAYMTSGIPSMPGSVGVWVSDGTAGGTFKITPDTITGVGEEWSGLLAYGFAPTHPILGVGGRAFFAATTPSLGSELWTSDGTLDGTHAVADFVPGPEGSKPLYLTSTPDGLLFAAHEADRQAGVYLATPDGSGIATLLHFDTGQTMSSSPTAPVTVGGKTFFLASAEPNEPRTWVTDGTPAGTFDLSDAVPGLAGLYCIPIGTVGDKALLKSVSSDPVPYKHYTYWESDGTPGGTFQVPGIPADADLSQGQKPYDPTQTTVVGTRTYSILKNDDGSETLQVGDSSGRVTALKSFPSGPSDQFPTDGVAFNAKYYFLVPGGPDRGLYTSDGTVAGTIRVANLSASSLDGLRVVGGQLTFILRREFGDLRLPPGLIGGDYLMASDGTSLGTYMVSALGPYVSGSYDHAVTEFGNGTFLIFADDGVHGTEPMLVTPDVPPPPTAPFVAADLAATAVGAVDRVTVCSIIRIRT